VRRMAIAITAASAVVATAVAAASARVAGWIPVVTGVLAGVFTLALVVDLVRRRG
jgi:CHASE2 domain-containing sensor protein